MRCDAQRGGAIVLAERTSASDLPHGWGVDLPPGGYRLRRRDDQAAFGHAAGPQSWKTYLHPPREQVLSVRRDPAGELTMTEPGGDPPRYAFLGVRPCDLRAIGVQDRVLGRGADSRYTARRAAALLIAVEWARPEGAGAVRIGTVTSEHPARVTTRTLVGARRTVDMLVG